MKLENCSLVTLRFQTNQLTELSLMEVEHVQEIENLHNENEEIRKMECTQYVALTFLQIDIPERERRGGIHVFLIKFEKNIKFLCRIHEILKGL